MCGFYWATLYSCSLCIWADFQLGDKPIGSLELCSLVEDNGHITAVSQAPTPLCMSVTIKSKLTKTPCILRRRRRKLYSNGKKSVVRCPKSSASLSSASPPVVVSSDCTRVASATTDACLTPKKEQSEQILPFSPSQVWIIHWVMTSFFAMMIDEQMRCGACVKYCIL